MKRSKVALSFFLLSKYAAGIGNSYCNLVSWKIMRSISQKKLKSQYTFLHTPKSLRIITLVKEIDFLLKALRDKSQTDFFIKQ